MDAGPGTGFSAKRRVLLVVTKRRPDVRCGEVISFEKQGKPARYGKRIGGAINDVQLRLMALSLSSA
jgi:hypothetical protein